ncbi:hypothetical protein HPP92_026447 [Vanilla planifolia]|uniref:Uncharacterized protein n=1 Tax=Vanilla planifolia TaxID=51239 RepID=A0A835PCT3_VANPL|nr:hypothetical protein HPP92_026447 [Vanilla planifolia]
MGSEAPTWAEQWGGMDDEYDKHDAKESSSKGKKMANVKAAAGAGLGKAKTAATAGAQKVKIGTSMGISWIKNKYQKRTSSNVIVSSSKDIQLPCTTLKTGGRFACLLFAV